MSPRLKSQASTLRHKSSRAGSPQSDQFQITRPLQPLEHDPPDLLHIAPVSFQVCASPPHPRPNSIKAKPTIRSSARHIRPLFPLGLASRYGRSIGITMLRGPARALALQVRSGNDKFADDGRCWSEDIGLGGRAEDGEDPVNLLGFDICPSGFELQEAAYPLQGILHPSALLLSK